MTKPTDYKQVIAVTMACALPSLAIAHPDTTSFQEGIFVTPPAVVDCTLENGTQTQCHQLTVGYKPEGLEIGPFCPTSMDDVGGIWPWSGENAGLYRVNAEFLTMLDELGYRFFDDDGTVHVADIAIAEPEVDHACINVSEDADVEITMLLPVTPVLADAQSSLGVVSKVGVALDGVPIFSDAPPVHVTGHMPALDVCGGHVDPGGWYHWHSTASDIDTVFQSKDVDASCLQDQDASAVFGYAFDGFPILGSKDAGNAEPVGLDDCNGHTGALPDGGEGYHYHASDDFPNLPACLIGVQAEGNFVTTASAGIGALNAGDGGRNEAPRPGGGGPDRGTPPGFDKAAETLGISVDALMKAMEQAGGRDADLAKVAETLNIDEATLRTALPQRP